MHLGSGQGRHLHVTGTGYANTTHEPCVPYLHSGIGRKGIDLNDLMTILITRACSDAMLGKIGPC
jgi:hypothetical protein